MLEKVSILLKTFLRDQHLCDAINGVMTSMPEAQMIVVDDGEQDQFSPKQRMYERLRGLGHIVIVMPFDSGFGAKSNAGAAACERPYLLIGSDDFDFRPRSVREGIERLVSILEHAPEIAVASGRVNGYPYEGWLRDRGDRIIEEYIKFDQPRQAGGVQYHLCNLTVNYSLIRRSILGPGKIEWDDDVKIGGGEHGAQFVKIKRAGHAVAWVPGVNICEQQGKPTDVRYQAFRGRARQPGRLAFQKLGIKEYVCFGGNVEVA